jgi:hypothetical protein
VIVIATSPKRGMTWMQQIVNSLVFRTPIHAFCGKCRLGSAGPRERVTPGLGQALQLRG